MNSSTRAMPSMIKFRKKPVIVEAIQFDVIRYHDLPFVKKRYPDGDKHLMSTSYGCRVEFVIVTAHGRETLIEHGDWIIAEPDGCGYYPCKPDIFADIYERVEN